MTSPRRVAVLGGGACGLTAAHALASRGADVTVLEREPRPGGLCGTVERAGFRFDFGGHRFISRSRALEDLVRELVGDELLVRTRSSAVLHRGRRFRYPLELDDVVRTAGLRRGAGAVLSYAGERVRQRLNPSGDVSFEDWVVHRFGRSLYDAFFGPYTEKLWGLAPTEISADWASQRISLLSLSDVMLRLVGARRSPTRSYARRYLYPRLGIGQIFERMTQAIARAGGRVQLGARVSGLDVARGRVRAVRFSDERGDHELACDAAIATLALPDLARFVGVRGEAARASSRLRFRAIRLHNLLLDGPEVSPHTWMYVSEPRYLMSRIQEPRHRSPDMAPPGATSLMLEIPCDRGDAVWSAPEDELHQRCLADLRALGFDVASRVRGRFSTFVEEGYPIYHLDYRRDRARALGAVGEVENLIACGRQGAFRYVFMDTAMEMGLEAARAALGERRTAGVADLNAEGGLIEARALTA
ncbi:MAG TPA: FAD-dependent oxidoreductase [Polyangia bacterium]|nr:FAD-dependent oxidoreductase [Polyangia bacterium]